MGDDTYRAAYMTATLANSKQYTAVVEAVQRALAEQKTKLEITVIPWEEMDKIKALVQAVELVVEDWSHAPTNHLRGPIAKLSLALAKYKEK